MSESGALGVVLEPVVRNSVGHVMKTAIFITRVKWRSRVKTLEMFTVRPREQ